MSRLDSRLKPHRQALLSVAAPAESCRATLAEGGRDLLDFIVAQDHGALWHRCGAEALRDACLLMGEAFAFDEGAQ